MAKVMLSEKMFQNFMAKNCLPGECFTELGEMPTMSLLRETWWERNVRVPPAIKAAVDNLGDLLANTTGAVEKVPDTLFTPIVSGVGTGVGGYLSNPENIEDLVNVGIASQTGGLGSLGGLFGGAEGSTGSMGGFEDIIGSIFGGGGSNGSSATSNQQGKIFGIDPIFLIGAGVLLFVLLNRK